MLRWANAVAVDAVPRPAFGAAMVSQLRRNATCKGAPMHNGSSLGVRDDRRGGLGQGRQRLGSGPDELTFLLPGSHTRPVARRFALVPRLAWPDVMVVLRDRMTGDPPVPRGPVPAAGASLTCGRGGTIASGREVRLITCRRVPIESSPQVLKMWAPVPPLANRGWDTCVRNE